MRKFNALWMKLIKPLLNERGEVGDFHKEEFSKEELEALGEAPAKVDDSKTGDGTGKSQEELDAEAAAKAEADKAAQDTSKTEQTDIKPVELTAEEQALAAQEGVKLVTENGKQYLVDDDGAKIPVERWKKNYAKTQADIRTATQTTEETNRKYNLLKELGADKYYEIYPDEKPANYQPPAAKTEVSAQPVEDFNTMLVNGGKYDGWQLGDVAKEDPISANLMLNNYLESKRAVVEKETRRKADFEQSFAQERNQFCLERGKELFNKSDNYTDAEKAQIVKVYDDFSRWAIANKKSHYNMEDAYLLMNKDKIISSKVAEASKAAIEKITAPGVKSIGSESSSGKETGFESYLTMTEGQLTDAIDKMSDKEFKTFLKESPKALRDKYPSVF